MNRHSVCGGPSVIYLVGLITIGLGGCDLLTDPDRVPADLTLDRTSVELADGDSTRLVATVTNQAGEILALDDELVWTSSDSAVVLVSRGMVRAVAPGQAEVVAMIGEISATASLTVVPVASTITPLLGDNQAGIVLEELEDSLIVAVEDRHGEPVAGVEVVWSASGGTVSATSTRTDANGRTGVRWRLGAEAGEQTTTATTEVGPVVFRADARLPTSSDLELELLVRGISPFAAHIASPPSDPRVFLAGIDGLIQVIDSPGAAPRPFLDLRHLVARYGEMGFFSITFHPAFAQNGFFYVNYVDRNSSLRIDRFTASQGGQHADIGSRKLILDIGPSTHHFGGTLQFGPDGLLYISVGEQHKTESVQDTGSLVGKILRIDVDGGDPYSMPSSNPFVGVPGARGEVWATGLRNPWRMTIDSETGFVYIGDVGGNRWEEINVVHIGSGGANFGWPLLEGSDCVAEQPELCQGGFTAPKYGYTHSPEANPMGCSVTGGLVYRGAEMPWLQGHYLFGDFCEGWIQTLRYDNGSARDIGRFQIQTGERLISFGQDSAGELYLSTISGSVYRIRRADSN